MLHGQQIQIPLQTDRRQGEACKEVKVLLGKGDCCHWSGCSALGFSTWGQSCMLSHRCFSSLWRWGVYSNPHMYELTVILSLNPLFLPLFRQCRNVQKCLQVVEGSPGDPCWVSSLADYVGWLLSKHVWDIEFFSPWYISVSVRTAMESLTAVGS